MAINNVILSGRLVAKPEMNETNNGTKLSNVTIAVDDGYGDKKEVYFLDVTLWKHGAEFAVNYCDKGDEVIVQAKAVQQKWEKDGKNFSKVIFSAFQIEKPNGLQDRQQGGFKQAEPTQEVPTLDITQDDLPF